MPPLSGNQRPDLLNMSLVLRLPRKMHLRIARHLRPLTLPHCRPLEVLVPESFFCGVVCYFCPPRIFMDHVEVDTWKAWRPLFLGTVQSARNFGHWKVYHFRSRISTCIYGTLRVFTALLSLAEHGAKRWSAVFMCKKVCVHMGHGPWIWNYRFGWATSWTNTCKVHKRGFKKNRMPGTIHRCSKRSWSDISQLILWIYLHQAHRYELRPTIPAQPSELKCKTTWFIIRNRLSSTQGSAMISPNSFCEFVFTRAIDTSSTAQCGGGSFKK